ncbi:MAG TPA: hypothetical protein VI796_06915, partial [Candidatus Thermoplasmatota archaeon]|nr:hypothetical protein [Candidatus Thermoplasmatota archaeon]
MMGLCALALATLAPAASAARTGNPFPLEDWMLYLTDAASGEMDGAKLLQPELSNANGQTVFLAPGVGVAGLVDLPSTAAWVTSGPSNRTMEM